MTEAQMYGMVHVTYGGGQAGLLGGMFGFDPRFLGAVGGLELGHLLFILALELILHGLVCRLEGDFFFFILFREKLLGEKLIQGHLFGLDLGVFLTHGALQRRL